MNEPKRLRQQGVSRLTTVLLEAARTDAPPKARLERMLGVGAGAGVVLAAETAGAAAVGATPVAKSVVGIALVIKWLGMGAVAGAVVSAGATQISRVRVHETSGAVAVPTPRDEHAASAPAVAARLAEPRSVVELPAPTAAPATQAHRSEPHPGPVRVQPRSVSFAASSQTPQIPQSPAETATPAATSEAVAEQSGSPEARVLREEILALGRAKAALNRSAPGEALSVIRDYRARFPLGRLGPEATYLEMEAELANGNRARAESIAERLASGAAPNAERAREILKGGK
jgi:hypothetical protein